jgi:hypothetical protein
MDETADRQPQLCAYDSKLENASQGELALTDWFRIAGLLIFVAFICFSIVLFSQGANHLPANQRQALVPSTPTAETAGLEPRPESTPEIRAQPELGVTPAETQPRLREVFSEPAQGTIRGAGATYELATTNPTRANVMLGNRSNLSVRRVSSRRRVALYKYTPRSIKVLIETWFRTFRTKSHR